MIGKLTVFYDARCGFCRRCARWLEVQVQMIPLELLPTNELGGSERYPGLVLDDELTVISDEGGVYRGSDAWIMTLYALAKYRAWSFRFSSPLLKPLVRNAFEMLSNNRMILSRLLGLRDRELEVHLRSAAPALCEINDKASIHGMK
jgi:predicted DCC family thiol-disulfide oxidoreductase YuxK